MLRDRLVEKRYLTPEHVRAYLRCSFLFTDEHWPVVDRGIDAYFAEDFVVALHLWIPRIEGLIRVLARALRASLYHADQRGGALRLRAIDELLRDAQVEEALTPSAALYLRVLLTDGRGWNLRNALCHAFVPANALVASVATRILQVLLFLGLFRLEEEATSNEPTR